MSEMSMPIGKIVEEYLFTTMALSSARSASPEATSGTKIAG